MMKQNRHNKPKAIEIDSVIKAFEEIYIEKEKEKERTKKALLDGLNDALNGKEIILENSSH